MNFVQIILNKDDINPVAIDFRLLNFTECKFKVEWFNDFSTSINSTMESKASNRIFVYSYRYGTYQIYQAKKKNHTYSIKNIINLYHRMTLHPAKHDPVDSFGSSRNSRS